MDIGWRCLLFLLAVELLPLIITGLDELEGETITLTCPLPTFTYPVVWEGPKDHTKYSRGSVVDVNLSADQRSRISVTGDNANGYFNLEIRNVKKSDSGNYRCKIGRRIVRRIKVRVKTQEEQNQGLFPYILNLATRARISTNATCGESAPEYFCKLVEHVDLKPQISHCDYCNARAGEGRLDEIGSRHPINYAIDGSNKWWQSPSISNGIEYNYVTITLDLGLIYQVAYVVVKAANAPRPGNWILEKSVDGVNFYPWQYFAMNEDDCWKVYKVQAIKGKPSYDYLRDDEVRCTSYFSKLNPMDNGEIFVSLTNGRPGIFVPSKTLLDFTSARYVRLRFQKIRTLNAHLMSLQSRDPRNLDPSVTRRYFYSIKDISIGGQCICYGHASECQKQGNTDRLACVCQHNTCGSNCEVCCPLFNQKPWVRGGSNGINGEVINVECQACNCHGHADECVYNATVDAQGLSMNLEGQFQGGGVCIDCQDFTTGINCERCLPGYYRPWGVSHHSRRPCRQCNCQESVGSTGVCVEDDSRVDDGLMPGSCICRVGYAGQNCDQCAPGYHGYPYCEPCSCSIAGTVDPNMCEGSCVCKENVVGRNCDRCEEGFYDLSVDNELGCRQCFCFGVSNRCQSAGLGLVQITDMSSDMDGWTIITLNDVAFTLFPNPTDDGWLQYRTFPAREQNVLDISGIDGEEVVYYWQAPMKYYGNRLASYGGQLHYTLQYTIDESAPWRKRLAEANVILQGMNITVTNGRGYMRENQEIKDSLTLDETQWFELGPDGRRFSSNHVTRRQFMLLLYDLRRILIRATHHTAQDNVMLKNVLLDTSDAGSASDVSITGVEKCSCPRGYTGLSCESCDVGWRRVDNVLYGGTCVPCECNGHSKTCDPYTGRCLMCTDNTEGVHCDKCMAGFYGDPTRGTPDDCKPCACPLTEVSNNFATQCTLSPKYNDPDAFICLDCAPGYTGERCERCDNGYFGLPGLLGSRCEPCDCNGNIDSEMGGSCDQLTGECYICLHNTEGPDCGTCQDGYYGTAVNGDCKLCNCDPFGSTNMTCDVYSGQCQCKEHYTGRQCDRCKENYWGLKSGQGCTPCHCDPVGSYFAQCDGQTGQCRCKLGVAGIKCDECAEGYYGLSTNGECRECEPCNKPGHICHPDTGECVCPPNTMGERCEQCIDTYWGYDARTGCQSCDCDPEGSNDNNCDRVTGQCSCKLDFNGTRCDSCQFGLYNFPDCSFCLCSVEGTEPSSCNREGSCSCSEPEGQCMCKENTMSRTCSQCKENTFSLDEDNPDGCTSCYCFGRADSCGQADYVWSKRTLPEMLVSFNQEAGTRVTKQRNGYFVIPGGVSWTGLSTNSGNEPLYWRLQNFIGDMTLSYNGELSFTLEYGDQDQMPISEELLDKPLVVLIGHNIPLLYRSAVVWQRDTSMMFTVSFHEDNWQTQRGADVNRKMLMIILQNINSVLVRATWDGSATSARIGDIQLDTAVEASQQLGTPALGIEQCICPPQYSGLSCQDPAEGYYRVPHVGPIDFTDLTGIIGDVALCECHGHSTQCDPDTGVCFNCSHNTAGDHCEVCARGYYGDPTFGSLADCQKCACPHVDEANNFSPTCERVGNNLICTACEKGYAGDRCEYCAEGYYGNPSKPGETCQECGCNPEGSVTARCDRDGRCECEPGIMGEKCDQCQPRHAVVQGRCVSCDEGCTRSLMLDLDHLENMTDSLPFDLSNVNISAPYRKLALIRNTTKILSERLENLQIAAVQNVQDDLNDLERQVADATARSEAALDKTNSNKKDADKLKRSAEEMESIISLLHLDVEELVDQLEESVAASYHNRSGINVTESLDEARKILRQIKQRDFTDEENESRTELRAAEDLLDLVKVQMNKTGLKDKLTELMDKVTGLYEALIDLTNLEEQSVKNSEETQEKVAMLKDVLSRIKDQVKDLRAKNTSIVGDLRMADDLILDSYNGLQEFRDNIKVLEEDVSRLDAAMPPLKEKEMDLRDNLPDAEVKVNMAIAHANNLSNFAENLEKTFESTRNAAQDPLRAASVYDDIVKAIEEAAAAARKANEDIKNATTMANLGKLDSDAEASRKESEDLKKQAEDHNVDELEQDVRAMKDTLDSVEETQAEIVDKHQDLKDALDKLPTDFVNRVADVKEVIDSSRDKAAEVNMRTKDMVDLVNAEMKPKLEELKDLNLDDFNDIAVTLQGAQKNLTDMKNLTDSLDRRFEQSRKLQSDLGDKLSKLKQSIREAREEANKVKTSLQSDGQCVRKFRSTSQPGTINTISFAFKAREPQKNMLFVLIQNQEVNEGDNDKEFLSVELFNRRVRFSWNAGGGTASLDSSVEIKSEATIIKEAEKWYKVTAERIGRLGRLTVHPIAEESGPPETKASPIGFSVMTLSETADLYIAGSPTNYNLPPGVTSFNFTGCMGSVYIDDKPIGLYNFQTTTMDTCTACLEVPSENPGTNIYSFDGTGYAVTDKANLKNPVFMSFNFEFSTYWENASLFFIGNSSNGEFMSLELENGNLVLHFYQGSISYARLVSENRYNTNKWVSVAIMRNGYFGLMEIDKTEDLLTQAPDGDYLLSVQNSEVFFGGLPPTVDTKVYEKASGQSLVTNRFLGCMQNIQMSIQTLNLWDGKTTVGVTEGCKNTALRSIGFYGAGFAEFPGTSLDTQEADLSLSFSTLGSDALLLLAKNINGDSYYSLSLVNGQVIGKFSSGRGSVTLKSKQAFNDGRVHNIAVKKTDRRIELFVDDTMVDEGRVQVNSFGNSFIIVREDGGGLYLGGVPGFQIDEMASTSASMNGCISDIVVNRKVLNINEPKQYDLADIGRCSHGVVADEIPPPFASDAPAAIRMPEREIPVVMPTEKSEPKVAPDTSVKPKTSTVPVMKPCAANTGIYKFETDAFTFGEEDISFNQINVTKKEVLRKFTIDFDFRTYYGDGILFYLSNLDHTAFVAAMLKNGSLVLAFERNGKIKEVEIEPKSSLTDGEWHSVTVEKNRQRIEMKVDGNSKRGAKIGKVLKVDVPLFVGGIPSSFLPLLNKNVVRHSLRGCMRNLRINNNKKNFSDTTMVSGVDKCFTQQEKGAHFTGKSFGIFARAFEVGRELDIDLEFRTSKPEGILASVSNQDGEHAMTLQLHQGQVKFTILNPGGQMTAETVPSGQWSVCDGSWHKVQARVIKNVITLQVDDQELVSVPSQDTVTHTLTSAPLFLGGVPDFVTQAAAHSREGFEGCLRNVQIQGIPVDWFRLDSSVAIHRTSCPVS